MSTFKPERQPIGETRAILWLDASSQIKTYRHGGTMPKSADPNRYLDNFKYQVKNAKDRYQRLEQSLDSSHESNDTKKGVAEDSAFRLGVLWETFQGDWFVAAISRNSSAFVGEMQGQLHKAVSDKWARDVIEMKSPGALTIPNRPTLHQIEKMLDPQGFNITFTDHAQWLRSAKRYLVGEHLAAVSRVAGDTESTSLLHLVKKMRNHLAHASTGSKEEFNKAARTRSTGERIGLTGSANNALTRDDRGVADLGKYLRAKVEQNGPRRLEILHERIVQIAEFLRV